MANSCAKIDRQYFLQIIPRVKGKDLALSWTTVRRHGAREGCMMPLDTEALLDRAAEAAADGGAAFVQGLPVLSVIAGGESYALPLGAVREVTRLGPITAVPGLGSGLVGAMAWHGDVLAVVDLGPALGLAAAGRAEGARMVVASLGGEPVGLLVDAVGDIDAVSPPEESTGPDGSLAKVRLPDGRLASLLDLERALARLLGH